MLGLSVMSAEYLSIYFGLLWYLSSFGSWQHKVDPVHILFGAIINGMLLLISNSNCLILVYRITTLFYM
jgi:hypothetical protein